MTACAELGGSAGRPQLDDQRITISSARTEAAAQGPRPRRGEPEEAQKRPRAQRRPSRHHDGERGARCAMQQEDQRRQDPSGKLQARRSRLRENQGRVGAAEAE